MKFGEELRSSLIQEFYWHYIDYEGLKKALEDPYETAPTPTRPNPKRRHWSDKDDEDFLARLEAELEKVYSFQKVKRAEIVARVKQAETAVHDVVQRNKRAQQNDSEAALDETIEDDFVALEHELGDIIADVHDLDKFTRLNYTGFNKIIKKHDKMKPYRLRPQFAASLKEKPFFQNNTEAFVIKLSDLWNLVRTRGNPITGDNAAGGSQAAFIRQTTKYWVHPDNVTEVKLFVMKHLPVLVFNPNKEFDPKDTCVSSIYYDNPDTWELYMGRLKKTEGAQAIRLRWYGSTESEEIFPERKTHREDWTGETSVKERVPIVKEKYVNAYMQNKVSVEKLFEKKVAEGKVNEKQLALARGLQERVIKDKMVPVCRTFCNRTAFQLPADQRVRISLDTELTMVREDNLDGRQRSGDNWRRTDIGVDWPFPQLPAEDVERFPYAILEIKLACQPDQIPQWVRDLATSHLVESVPKFSKFLHGVATLFPDKIKVLPFWMPQMGTDIRKPAKPGFGTEHQSASRIDTSSEDPLDNDSDTEPTVGGSHLSPKNRSNGTSTPATSSRNYSTLPEYPREDQADAEFLDAEERIAALPALDEEDYPLYYSDSEDEDDELAEAREAGGWKYRYLLVKHHANAATDRLLSWLKPLAPVPRPTAYVPQASSRLAALGNGVKQVKWQAPPGKRIYVPVRVEPKVSFAAERTFLSWLEFSILLGSIAATLLNFGATPAALAGAWAFTFVAVLALFYSLVVYLYRVENIKKRKPGRGVYYERWGPSALCAALVVAVVIDFVWTFAGFASTDGEGSGHDELKKNAVLNATLGMGSGEL